MNCKDCIHKRVCEALIEQGLPYNDRKLPAEAFCMTFRDKSRFVELPCRCKDCEHFNKYNPDRAYCEEHSDDWGDNIVYVDEDDYCSFGIRKKVINNG